MRRLLRKATLPTLKNFYNLLDYDLVEVGEQLVPISKIIGLSDGRVDDYNNDWTPKDSKEYRWENIYEGYKNGSDIPSIPLIKAPDGYFFANGDGNHRISAVKVLRLSEVNANVSVMVPKEEQIEIQWEKYSQTKQSKLDLLSKKYQQIMIKIDDIDRNNPNYHQLKEEESKIVRQIYKIEEELEAEEKEFKHNLLEKYLNK